MHTSFSSAQVEQFRRDARRLARAASIPLNQAQDQIAGRHGFRNWSLLVKHSTADGSGASPKPVAPAPDTRRRYYLHGDQHETDPALYYCVQCDLFVDGAHFIQHGEETFDRALHSIERWEGRPPDRAYRRPHAAANLLEAEARRRRAAREALRSAFHRWLERQQERDDPIGDLARDALADRSFPVAATMLVQLREYLELQRASPDALRALDGAWMEFSRGA